LHQAVVLSSQAEEVENHPLVVVVLGLEASACQEVEEAFFQVAVVLVVVGCHWDLVLQHIGTMKSVNVDLSYQLRL